MDRVRRQEEWGEQCDVRRLESGHAEGLDPRDPPSLLAAWGKCPSFSLPLLLPLRGDWSFLGKVNHGHFGFKFPGTAEGGCASGLKTERWAGRSPSHKTHKTDANKSIPSAPASHLHQHQDKKHGRNIFWRNWVAMKNASQVVTFLDPPMRKTSISPLQKGIAEKMRGFQVKKFHTS